MGDVADMMLDTGDARACRESFPICQITELSGRAKNILKYIGARTVGQYRELELDDLKHARSCGAVTMREMQRVLGPCGFDELGEDLSSITPRLDSRTWLAGMAMQAFAKEHFKPRHHRESSAPDSAEYRGKQGQDAADTLAADAYWIADAMIAAGAVGAEAHADDGGG